MKLKKILALALSGILAVSMLAGCGGAANVNLNDNVSRDKGVVTESVNKKLKDLDVDFKADGIFASQLAIVANNITAADVQSQSAAYNYLAGEARNTLTYLTKATWMDSAPAQEGTYVCGIWFDGGMSAEEVSTVVATYLDKAAAINDQFDVTKASMETYKVTMGTDASEKSVWLVGILVTLADKTNNT